ncbi:MAG: RluA family pseudouridine synthase [Anaeroplasmataceae bacterium]
MLDILYEDNHIIVCVKPKGILSQEDITQEEDMLTILKSYIKNKYNKPGNVFLGLVHRLDKNSTGIMVFARTSKAAKRLFESITSGLFKKEYIALVEGIIEPFDNQITLIDYMYKDEVNKKSVICDIDDKYAKKAELNYSFVSNLLHKNTDCTLLSVKLITGRFHQIRCQLSNIGYPLYADVKYNSRHKSNDYFFLLANKLSFPHPTTNEVLEFKIDYNNYL